MVNSVAPALQITLTSTDFRQAYVDLKGVEGNLRVQLRKGITSCAAPLVTAVRQQASWSSRIPGAVKAKTSFAAKSAGVAIVVDSKKAPEGRPLENGGVNGTFRHPVFGDITSWVPQSARPFFWAAVRGRDSAVDRAMVGVLDAVARQAGFK